MEALIETVFPQSPNLYLPKIFTTRRDGTVAYGSKNTIVILRKIGNQKIDPSIINEAHDDRITSVSFLPNSDKDKDFNMLLSSSDDGFLKLWNIHSLLPTIGHTSHSDPKDSGLVKVVCADWSRSSFKHVVSVAENDTVVLWDITANETSRYVFYKLKPTVVECSFHSEKVVAVGSKSGLVYVLKLVKKGEVLHKLRGHDKEVQALSWCPAFVNVLKNKPAKEYLLASSCQEKEIFIWRILDGTCETIIELPKNPLSKGGENHYRNKSETMVNFIPLFWGQPNILHSGTKFGELICIDFENYLSAQVEDNNVNEKKIKRKSSNCWKLVHSYHTSILLGICGVAMHDKNKFYSEENCEKVLETSSSDPSKDGFFNSNFENTDIKDIEFQEKNVEILPEEQTSLIWTIGKDQKIIAVNREIENKNATFNFHTLNGHPYEAVVSPHDPNKIAIAAGDGKIRLWNVTKPSGESLVYWQKINDRVYSLAWHPAKEGVLAYGTSKGRVGLIDIYSAKNSFNFKIGHAHTTYRLSWGPPFSEDPTKNLSEKNNFCLYSVGGNNLLQHDPKNMNSAPLNLTKIVNFHRRKQTDICWKPDYTCLAVGSNDGTICLLKPPHLKVIHVLYACKKLIQSITWHPIATTMDMNVSGLEGYFTFGSTDNDSTLKVFNCFGENDVYTVEQVAALKGHTGYIQYVSWCPHIGGRLISASADFSVKIWDVINQTQLITFFPSKNRLPLFCIWSPIDPDILISGFADRTAVSWRISGTSDSVCIVKGNQQKSKKLESIGLSELINCVEASALENDSKNYQKLQEMQNNKKETYNVILAQKSESFKGVKEIKMFGGAWKSDKDLIHNCYELLKESEDTEARDMKFMMPFLASETQFMSFLNTEEESHKKGNNWNEFYQLILWRGNLKEVIEEKMRTGHLDDYLLSLAPSVSPRLWQEACISYSQTLTEKKMYRKAACYLIVVHRIYDAINLLLSADLYLEAICVARCRLPKSDPIFNKIIRNYADWLTKTGSFLRAGECFIYLRDFKEAATILAKKTQPEYLSLAAIAAKKAGLEDLEVKYANNCLLFCMENLNWELAIRICEDHENLKQLLILFTTYRLLYQLDTEELHLEKNFITHLMESTGISGDSFLYSTLIYLYDKNALYSDRWKMFAAVAQELSLASCAVKREFLLIHIIRALNSASRFTNNTNDIHPLYKLCKWLSPNNYFAKDSIFCYTSDGFEDKIKSIRAFLGHGIILHLNQIMDQDNIVTIEIESYEGILKELIDDILDKEAFTYFKNQIEIKECEKIIMETLTKRKEEENNTDQDREGDGEIDGENSDLDDEKLNSKDLCCDPLVTTKGVMNDEIDKKITEKKDEMNRMKNSIKNFENTRIIAPNPVFDFYILRKIAQMFPSRENENSIENVIEEKWSKLQEN